MRVKIGEKDKLLFEAETVHIAVKRTRGKRG